VCNCIQLSRAASSVRLLPEATHKWTIEQRALPSHIVQSRLAVSRIVEPGPVAKSSVHSMTRLTSTVAMRRASAPGYLTLASSVGLLPNAAWHRMIE
jgi:hypothetical protein